MSTSAVTASVVTFSISALLWLVTVATWVFPKPVRLAPSRCYYLWGSIAPLARRWENPNGALRAPLVFP
jgi:hypothetical protein